MTLLTPGSEFLKRQNAQPTEAEADIGEKFESICVAVRGEMSCGQQYSVTNE